MRMLSWHEVYERLKSAPPGKLYGVPRGGQIVAGLTGRAVDSILEADAIVDDIIDSGATRQRYAHYGKPFWALWDKAPGDGWIAFPWEGSDLTADIKDTVVRQLEAIGEDPNRDGLKDTPKRVIKALLEMTSGYGEDPGCILSTTFDVEYDEVVVLRDIAFTSLCEHHMLPFTGTATIGYLPGKRVVGLSKLARLVHCHAKRLQVQERMTQDIAKDIEKHLKPKGVAVVVRGIHNCMVCRGVRLSGAEMVTSAMRGAFREQPALRSEFMGLAASHCHS